MSDLLRVVVIGATGSVGTELIGLLEERRFPLQELRPVASDRSLGEGIDILDQDVAVETGMSSLRGLDRVFVCAPDTVALEWVRRCLRDEVRCIDVSGAMAGRGEVPLVGSPEGAGAPVVSVPPPAALALARVLAVIPVEGLRVSATWLVGAGHAGRGGVDALQGETIALFNQSEMPETGVFGREIAFDAIPLAGDDPAGPEPRVAGALERLVPGTIVSVAAVRVPVFSGLGLQVSLQADRALDPAVVRDALAKAPGIAIADGPISTRDALGRDEVHVGALRAEPTRPGGVRFWVATDPVRLVAAAAVEAARPAGRAAAP